MGECNLPQVSNRLVIEQLTKWMEQCEEQAKAFEASNMEGSAACSMAMAQAYWNVKQFIEVNGC